MVGLALATLALYVVMSIVVALLDDKKLDEDWEPFVWTASQLLTGGSSLSPSSAETHVVGVVLQVWAVFAIAALAGSFGAFFHRRGLERDPLPTVRLGPTEPS